MSRMFPVQKVRAAFFTAGKIPVEDAYRIGSIERVVPLDRLKAEGDLGEDVAILIRFVEASERGVIK
jgi:enoyl-CoA hydratase/carnithine racemase